MNEEEYFRNLKDYEEIRPYLEESGERFEDTYQEPAFECDLNSAIVVENLPVVGAEKRAKLIGVVFKLYSQIASYLTQDDIDMPSNEKGTSYGFCMIKFRSAEDAQKAILKTQKFTLTSANVFKVTSFADIEKYSRVKDEYVPPVLPEYTEAPDLSAWLGDAHGRDQFVLRHGKETEIYWANTAVGEEPVLCYGGEREKEGGKVWCERHVMFSPQGNYLVTFHTRGVMLWGGDVFETRGRFLHPNVETMEFSPCEKYLITYSSDPFPPGYNHHAQGNNNTPVENIIVWSVETCTKLRVFSYKNALDLKMLVNATVIEESKGKKVERTFRGKVTGYNEKTYTYSVSEGGKITHNNIPSDKVQALQNPNVLKWSCDGKYLARLGADTISVYEMPTVQLLDKKSFAAKDMLNFTWSPCENMLSYWCPTSGNYPAMINIVDVVQRKEICSRKCFDVLEGSMKWQSNGEYLCVYMTKQQGKKRSYVLMFFRVKEAGVPVELIELSDAITNVSWEPSGERIAITHGEPKSCTVTFYSMFTTTTSAGKKGGNKETIVKELSVLQTINNTQCSEVIWSPAGGICAIAYFVPGDACSFQLYDVDNTVSLATRRHDRCTGLYWDPSGRVIASVTSSPMINGNIVRGAPLQVDDSYNLWSFQGTPICVVRKEKLYKFIWRPRPANLLSLEERRAIVKNLKKYEKVFEREDKVRKAEMHQEATTKRNSIASEFLARLAMRKEEIDRKFGGTKAWKMAARGGYDEDDDSNYEICQQFDEVVLHTKEQVISQ